MKQKELARLMIKFEEWQQDEQEKPTLIVMSFDEYQKTPIKQEARMPRKEESSPLYNRSVGDRPVGALPERQRGGREEDLTIDDLPV